MPNLFSDLPVEIFACVIASTLGLMRTETRRGRAHRGRDFAQPLELGLALDVEAVDAELEGAAHLGVGLGDAREDDLVRRNAGGDGALELAARDHVGAGALGGEHLQHGLVGVGLHRIGEQRLDAVEGLAHHPHVAAQRCRRIAVERRADLGREVRQVDVLGVHQAVAILEMVDQLGAPEDEGIALERAA